MAIDKMPGVDGVLLRELPGRIFFYPSAGRDWMEPLSQFAEGMDEFRFVDICYQFNNASRIALDGWELVPGSTALHGPAVSRMSTRQYEYGHEFRHIEPAWLSDSYRSLRDGRHIRVTRRRGFGQYALHELPDSSLGVFWHRGDSQGEGGSNVWYLANRPRRHPPLSNLFEVLKRKLAYPALIASDGANTRFAELCAAARQEPGAPIRFEKLGLRWQQVARLGRNTVLWLVEPSTLTEHPAVPLSMFSDLAQS